MTGESVKPNDVKPAPTKPRVVLCGPMGAGKTSVGRVLARQWQVSFIDTDRQIEIAAGLSISQIFAKFGEAWFRSQEQQTVLRELQAGNGVLALGGGAPVDPASGAALLRYRQDGGLVVFLDVSSTAVATRVVGPGRPLLDEDDALGAWTRIAAARRALYEQIANMRIGTDGMEPAAVAAQIVRVWESAQSSELTWPRELTQEER